MSGIGLIVADPGHFHAALVQKEMYPNLSPKVHVYAPVGPDLADYLTRIARFNTRKEQPTHWQLEVHAGPDYLERMCHERPGTVAIFSGRNRGKVQRIQAAVEAGLNVLADKPLIVDRQELPVLEEALNTADDRGLIVYDMSSGGRQATIAALTRLLREDPEVFGDPVSGTRTDPGVTTASVHHIMKQVAGVPNLRPPWFFDITQQGEALADVGTHLVDRVHSTLFADQAIDYHTDIHLHMARRWPTIISAPQFRQVTGEADWPDYLEPWIKEEALEYFCNTRLQYEIRGVHIAVETRWDWEARVGDDRHTACYRGSRARLDLRQGAAEGYRSELYIVPVADIATAVDRRIAALQTGYPGVGLVKLRGEWRVTIPDTLRIGHEEHFAEMTRRFLDHVEHRRSLPASEKPNTLAKYYVCTEGVALSQGLARHHET
jgi:predicted dehydrogenase